MIITKKAIDRRALLRGFGTALALPLLDAMVPAMAATRLTAAKPAVRPSCPRPRLNCAASCAGTSSFRA